MRDTWTFRQALDPEGLDQALDPAGRDAAHVTLGHHRDQCPSRPAGAVRSTSPGNSCLDGASGSLTPIDPTRVSNARDRYPLR